MSLIIDLKVVPNAKMSKIILDKSGLIVVYVKSPPVDGKANKEVLKSFAKAIDINQSEITLVSGLTSKRKKIKIHKPLTIKDVMLKLGFDIQNNLG